MNFQMRLAVGAYLTLSLSGCFLLLPVTEPDQGGGTPSQRGAFELSSANSSNGNNSSESYLASRQQSRTNTGETRDQKRARQAAAYRTKKVQALVHQLQHGNDALRTSAATDLGNLNQMHSQVIPHLASALTNDKSKWVRRAAAKSLGHLGSQQGVAPLKKALSDRDKWVAHSAANALNRLKVDSRS